MTRFVNTNVRLKKLREEMNELSIADWRQVKERERERRKDETELPNMRRSSLLQAARLSRTNLYSSEKRKEGGGWRR